MSDFMEKLDELRKKHPGQLTEHDRAFLKARRSYLHPHELQAFGIEEEEQPEQAVVEDTDFKPRTVKKTKKASDEPEQ